MPSALFQALKEGSTLITATARLAREIRLEYDRQQLANGEVVWENPDLLPASQWFERCWTDLRGQLGLGRTQTLINDLQLTTIWEQIIAHDIEKYHGEDEPLWNIPSTARAAIRAWTLTRQWHLDPATWANSHQSDHQGFSRWAEAFARHCESNGWIDDASIIDKIIELLSLPSEKNGISPQQSPVSTITKNRHQTVIWIGFDRITTQQQRLINALQYCGFESHIWQDVVSIEPNQTTIHRYEYEDDHQQWLGAAQWARSRLEAHPDQRFAIVVPDLGACRAEIEHALSQTLNPRDMVEGRPAANRPFHLSLGQKTGQYPIVKAALNILELLVHSTLPAEQFSTLLLNPFVIGEKEEAMARARLEMRLRSLLPFQCTLRRFLDIAKRLASEHPCPVFIETLESLAELTPNSRSVQTFTYWGGHFQRALDQCGWPESLLLNSEEFQTVEAFNTHLKTLASLDAIDTHVNAATALNILEKRLMEQPFQSESQGKRLEVLGILEAAGIHFDAIWFAGLSEANWPPAIAPSPFIPRSVQEKAGIHQSSIALNFALARKMQQRLAMDCDELILSRAVQNKEIPVEPSPLFSGDFASPETTQFRLQEETLTAPRVLSLVEHLAPTHGDSDLELLWDQPGLEVTVWHGRGGTSLIVDQSLCPFRAYAHYRLAASANEFNDQGLDALDRGSIIHGALERIWTQIDSLNALKNLGQDQLETIITNSIERASERYAAKSGCGPGFIRTQNAWLTGLLIRWMEVERTRDRPFTIASLEHTQTLNLGGLELRFKIDRIDQYEDGSIVLIDYKTGTPIPLTQWIGPRPESPQLPLYAIAQRKAVEAVAFAHLNPAHLGYTGVSHGERFQEAESPKRVKPLDSTPSLSAHAEEWDALFSGWYHDLHGLAQQFLEGQAQIDPLNKTACERCDLHSLCRIHETETLAEMANPAP